MRILQFLKEVKIIQTADIHKWITNRKSFTSEEREDVWELLYPINLTIGKYNVSKDQRGVAFDFTPEIFNMYVHPRTQQRFKFFLDRPEFSPTKILLGWTTPYSIRATYLLLKYNNSPLLIAQKQTEGKQSGQFIIFSETVRSENGGWFHTENLISRFGRKRVSTIFSKTHRHYEFQSNRYRIYVEDMPTDMIVELFNL